MQELHRKECNSLDEVSSKMSSEIPCRVVGLTPVPDASRRYGATLARMRGNAQHWGMTISF